MCLDILFLRHCVEVIKTHYISKYLLNRWRYWDKGYEKTVCINIFYNVDNLGLFQHILELFPNQLKYVQIELNVAITM